MLIPGFLFRIMTSSNKTNLSWRNVCLDIKLDHGTDQVEENDDAEANSRNTLIQLINMRSDPSQILSRL